MTNTGRNAACPCGSGRKFKHCCLPKARVAPGAYTAQEQRDSLAKLMGFARRAEFADDVAIAQALFWGGRLDDMSERLRDELEADDFCAGAFVTWFLLDLDISAPGDTVCERFLAIRSRLSSGERLRLERLSASCLSVYQVLEVRLDEGLDLEDLLTGETVSVRERLATRELVPWDLIAVRVVPGPDDVPILDGSPYSFPVEHKDTLRQRLRALHAEATDGTAAVRKRHGMVLHHLWLDLVVNPPLPTLSTAEGDPLVFTKVAYDVIDQDLVAAALDEHDALDAQDDGQYVWLESSTPPARVLGTLLLRPGRLTLATQSEARAERGRQFVEEALGDAVRYRITTTEDLQQALDARAASPPPPSNIPKEVEQELVVQMLEAHYRSWPDHPLPALGNRTPRHAAKLKTVRPKLIALLQELDNRMEHDLRDGRPVVDLTWLWEELNVERR